MRRDLPNSVKNIASLFGKTHIIQELHDKNLPHERTVTNPFLDLAQNPELQMCQSYIPQSLLRKNRQLLINYYVIRKISGNEELPLESFIQQQVVKEKFIQKMNVLIRRQDIEALHFWKEQLLFKQECVKTLFHQRRQLIELQKQGNKEQAFQFLKDIEQVKDTQKSLQLNIQQPPLEQVNKQQLSVEKLNAQQPPLKILQQKVEKADKQQPPSLELQSTTKQENEEMPEKFLRQKEVLLEYLNQRKLLGLGKYKFLNNEPEWIKMTIAALEHINLEKMPIKKMITPLLQRKGTSDDRRRNFRRHH